MNLAITILLVSLAIAGVVTCVVYVRGSRWWTYPVGRALMAKSLSLTVVYAYVAIRRLTTHPLPPLPDHTGEISLAIYGTLLAVEIGLSSSFLYEWLKYRREARRGNDTTTG